MGKVSSMKNKMGRVGMNAAVNPIVDEKLSEESFEYWKACLRNYLIGEGLWDIVQRKEPDPAEKDSERCKDWGMRNARALHAIQISCGLSFSKALHGCKSAFEAWNYLFLSGSVQQKQQQQQQQRLQEAGDEESTKTERGEYEVRIPQYKGFWKSIHEGNLNTTVAFLAGQPEAIRSKITSKNGTPLHVAVARGHAEMVERSVERLEKEDMEAKDSFKWTPLALAAVGNDTRIAGGIIRKNPGTTSLRGGKEEFLPIINAALYGQAKMVRFVYSHTPVEELNPDKEDGGKNGPTLFNALIKPEIYDVALDLLRLYPKLGVSKDYFGEDAIRLLALKPSAFFSSREFVFWQRWIYSYKLTTYCSSDESADVESVERPQGSLPRKDDVVNRVKSFSVGRVWKFTEHLVPCIPRLFDTKLKHEEAVVLLRLIFHELSIAGKEKLKDIDIEWAMWDAVRQGIVEFIKVMLDCMPEMVWREDAQNRSVFANAIVHRREDIFSLLHGLGTERSIVGCRHDKLGKNFLHLAAKLSPPSQLERVSGAAMQMQRELHWFTGNWSSRSTKMKRILKTKHQGIYSAKNTRN